jgi:hypothetical protein
VVGIIVRDGLDQSHESVTQSLDEVLDIVTAKRFALVGGAVVKPANLLAVEWLVVLVDGPLLNDVGREPWCGLVGVSRCDGPDVLQGELPTSTLPDGIPAVGCGVVGVGDSGRRPLAEGPACKMQSDARVVVEVGHPLCDELFAEDGP